jgi:hypothetical protein
MMWVSVKERNGFNHAGVGFLFLSPDMCSLQMAWHEISSFPGFHGLLLREARPEGTVVGGAQDPQVD